MVLSLDLAGAREDFARTSSRASVSASARSEDDSGANFPRASGFRSGASGRSDGKAERGTGVARWLRAPAIWAPSRLCLLCRCMIPNLLVRGVHRCSGAVGRRRSTVGMKSRSGGEKLYYLRGGAHELELWVCTDVVGDGSLELHSRELI